jgi:hypothetical protein
MPSGTNVHFAPLVQRQVGNMRPRRRLGELLPDVWARAQRGAAEARSMEIADQIAAPASGFA